MPNNGFRAESSPPAVAAAIAGAAGTTDAAPGATLAAGFTDWTTTGSTLTVAGTVNVGRSTESLVTKERGAVGEGTGECVAGVESLAEVKSDAVAGTAVRRAAEDPEAVVPLAEPAAAAAGRLLRLRTDERRVVEVPVAVLVAASPLEGDGESAGLAQAVPVPPTVTATPIPSATASPPTRPTYADARIFNVPPNTGAQQSLSAEIVERRKISRRGNQKNGTTEIPMLPPSLSIVSVLHLTGNFQEQNAF